MVINCWPAGLQSPKLNPSEVKLFHKRTMAGKHVGKSAGLIMPTMNTIQHVRNEQSKRIIADMRNNMLQEGKKYSLTQDYNQAAAQVCVAPATHGPEQSMEDLGKRKLQAIFKDEIRLRAGLDSNPILNTGALFTWNASWSMSPKWVPRAPRLTNPSRVAAGHTHCAHSTFNARSNCSTSSWWMMTAALVDDDDDDDAHTSTAPSSHEHCTFIMVHYWGGVGGLSPRRVQLCTGKMRSKGATLPASGFTG